MASNVQKCAVEFVTRSLRTVRHRLHLTRNGLIALGAVVPTAHWQEPHAAAAGAGEIDDLLSEELHRKGSLEWNGPSGGVLLDKLAKAIDGGDIGWVSRPELERLRERLIEISRQEPKPASVQKKVRRRRTRKPLVEVQEEAIRE